MTDLISLGNGFYDLEQNSFRWTAETFNIFVTNKQVEFIRLYISCQKRKKTQTLLYSFDGWKTTESVPLKNGENVVDIKINSVGDIKFRTDSFSPSDIDSNSTDKRQLGVQLFNISCMTDSDVEDVPMKDIKFRKDCFIEEPYYLNETISYVSLLKGWHEIEHKQFRWSNGCSGIKLNTKKHTSLKIRFFSRSKSNIRLLIDSKTEVVTEIDAGDGELVLNNIIGNETITIISDTFTPSDLDPSCFDDRTLGIQLYSIQLIGDLNIIDIPIKNIFFSEELDQLMDFHKNFNFSDCNIDEMNSDGHVILSNFKNNSAGKINLNDQIVFYTHRSGWSKVIETLKSEHNDKGTKFEGFLERNFSWDKFKNIKSEIIPFKSPWVGVIHNPYTSPFNRRDIFSTEKLVKSNIFQKSLECCKGLFVLSTDLKNKIRPLINESIPIEMLHHPTIFSDKIFDFSSFVDNPNKRIINIGSWNRKYTSIYLLNSPLKKTSLLQCVLNEEKLKELIKFESNEYKLTFTDEMEKSVETLDYITSNEYDELLSKNVIFMDLHDVSASNLVIECLSRTTPLLVRQHPAIVEYLGESYPFYFDTLEEASEKSSNIELIKETHIHMLSNPIRKLITLESFKNSFINSEIYKSL